MKFATATHRLDRDEVHARITEHHVQVVYRALGVEHFGHGSPDDWLVSRPWEATSESRPSVKKLDGVWSDKARDEGGSIFDAVMRVQGCNFPEALQFVATITGLRSEPTNGKRKPRQSGGSSQPMTIPTKPAGPLSKSCATNRRTFANEDGAGGWVWNQDRSRLVLYRLSELLATLEAHPKRWVLIREGEKDTDRLWRLGSSRPLLPAG